MDSVRLLLCSNSFHINRYRYWKTATETWRYWKRWRNRQKMHVERAQSLVAFNIWKHASIARRIRCCLLFIHFGVCAYWRLPYANRIIKSRIYRELLIYQGLIDLPISRNIRLFTWIHFYESLYVTIYWDSCPAIFLLHHHHISLI